MKKIYLSLALVVAPFAGRADVLVNQTVTDVDGFGSGSYSSMGGVYGATIADDFSLGSAASIQEIQFTGSSDGFDVVDNSDFSSFQVLVMDSSFNILQNLTASVASLSPAATGRSNSVDAFYGGNEYVYTLATNFSLAAGSYRLAIGVNESNPNNLNGWVWSLGGDSVGTNYDNQFDGDGWNTYNTYPDQAFRISGTPAAVPEPATMTALGLGAVAMLRRRRK